MADGNVIEEEQRLGAGGEDVVHAHGDEILTDRLVTVEDLGKHELGAHAVRAGDEDRVLHVLERGSGEQAAETTDAADDLRAVGLLDHLLDRVDRAAALGGIDAGVLVRYVLALGHLRFLSTQGIPSLLDHLLDRVDRAAALGGIDAGVLVRYVLALGHLRFLSTQGIPSTA